MLRYKYVSGIKLFKEIFRGYFFRSVFYFFLLLQLFACSMSPFTLNQDIVFVEETKEQPKQISPPYTKYHLSNGLTVILSPDNSSPLVHVEVTYRVGSAHEEVGKTGLAHFLEHMMFQGSKHAGKGLHASLVTELGGSFGGATNRDRTRFYQSVPSNELEKILWLEADRMGFLDDSLSRDNLVSQQRFVRNEKSFNIINRPYEVVWEKMSEILFPVDHPYSWPTLGYEDDIAKYTLEDVASFYDKWYSPTNAILTIGGNFNTNQTILWIDKYFSSLPSAPSNLEYSDIDISLNYDKNIYFEAGIEHQTLVFSWPTTTISNRDRPAIDILADLLDRHEKIWLPDSISDFILESGSFHRCGKQACNLYIYVVFDDKYIGVIEKNKLKINNSITAAIKGKFEGFHLFEAVNNRVFDILLSLQNSKERVYKLSEYELYYNNPGYFTNEINQYTLLTKKDIGLVFDKYIFNKNKASLIVKPIKSHQSNVSFSKKINENIISSNKAFEPDKKKVILDNFDRSLIPSPQLNIKVDKAILYQIDFERGSAFIGSQEADSSISHLVLSIPSGHSSASKGKEGIAFITASVIVRESMKEQLKKYGSRVSFYIDHDSTNIKISFQNKFLRSVLSILESSVFNHNFEGENLEFHKVNLTNELIKNRKEVRWIVDNTLYQQMLPEAYGLEGSVKSIKSITINDITKFYRHNYLSSGLKITLTSSIPINLIKNELDFLNSKGTNRSPNVHQHKISDFSTQNIFFVDNKKTNQSTIAFVSGGDCFVSKNDIKKHNATSLFFSGEFNSRLNLQLRDNSNVAYKVKSKYSNVFKSSYFVISTNVSNQFVSRVINEINSELNKYSTYGISDREIKLLKLNYELYSRLDDDTIINVNNYIDNNELIGLDNKIQMVQSEFMEYLTRSELNKFIKKCYKPSKFKVIVIGDKDSLLNQLNSLGIPISLVSHDDLLK
ncbi:insulinase family protein [Vibrio sp. B1-2]|nr:insulinase family protein [Vibrio sp. B1-2]